MPARPLTHLGDMPVTTFLRDYWQKKPLFIKGALKDWQAPLDGNTLAGLALEDSVESRLIIEQTSSDPMHSEWQLEHGPLAEQRFETLPSSHFTVLIQALDQICPEVHELLNQFRFIPNWRLDDIMASIAPQGGSVGPHFDYYDVFLLQATGSRQWQLGQTCHSASPILSDCPLKILTDFECEAAHLAEPGDLLYIPAKKAHWGIAHSDDCTTYSIGFRAPSYSDILLELSEEIASQLSADERYRDLSLVNNLDPGLIPEEVIRHITEQCHQLFTPARVGQWLGQHLTEPKREAPDVATGPFTQCNVLAADCRVSYILEDQTSKNDQSTRRAIVFINGQRYTTSLSLAQAVSRYEAIKLEDYASSDQAVIRQWINNEYLTTPSSTDTCTDY